MKTHYIFTIGGVLSGLGKGLTTASVGLLLKQKGFKVTAVKIDPYISLDAGTMRPAEHGETFVTADGGEIDQDLGNYERFLEITLSKDNNITTGKIYQQVIAKERSFQYQGRDAQIFPDLINQIKQGIYSQSKGYDFCLIEIGGTTGDLENLPFLHAAREIGREHKAAYLMVTYLPFLRNVGELKTKPTQHAVAALREVGIFPDFIITRNEIPLDNQSRETISKRCFIDQAQIIDNPDTDLIYSIPLLFEKEKLADKILTKFSLKARKTNLRSWRRMVSNLRNPKSKVRIGIIGKYFKDGTLHKDLYVSVYEALRHVGGKLAVDIEIVPISSDELEKSKNINRTLAKYNLKGLIGPQGWGSRGAEGVIAAISWARKKKVPYLGLCFGMQLLAIEFARNVVGLKEANSMEINQKTKQPVVHIMADQKEYLKDNQYGGTIRLGNWPCKLTKGSLIEKLYLEHTGLRKTKKDTVVNERHRHRYELNNDYRQQLELKGLIISGSSPDNQLVEALELPLSKHPFFVGVQFHPEYKSHPLSPHPLFTGLINACLKA
jgi:CTP synthase